MRESLPRLVANVLSYHAYPVLLFVPEDVPYADAAAAEALPAEISGLELLLRVVRLTDFTRCLSRSSSVTQDPDTRPAALAVCWHGYSYRRHGSRLEMLSAASRCDDRLCPGLLLSTSHTVRQWITCFMPSSSPTAHQ